jgi:hypothetical protein
VQVKKRMKAPMLTLVKCQWSYYCLQNVLLTGVQVNQLVHQNDITVIILCIVTEKNLQEWYGATEYFNNNGSQVVTLY